MPPLPATERRRTLRAAAAVAWAALAMPTAFAAGTFGLPELAALLAQTPSGEATFTERREVAMLAQPLISSGRLWFQAPDTFVRETLKPRPEKLAVVGNTLTITQGARSRTLALDAAPEAGLVVEAIRGTLTGNRESLQKLFETSVSGSAERWSLELVPRDARLRAQVATVRVSGRQAEVREMQVVMPDGDRSTMTIEPTLGKPAGPAAAGSGAAR